MTAIIKIEESVKLIAAIPSTLQSNQISAQRAKAATDSFVLKAKEKYDEEVDQKANELIVKLKATKKKLNEARAPFTQTFDEIKKLFTAEEKAIDDMIAQVQPLRDSWAKKVIEEAEAKRREAERIAKIQLEKDSLKSHLFGAISLRLSNVLLEKKNKWQLSFNGITLENFADKEKGLKALKTTLTVNDIPTAGYSLPQTFYLTPEEKESIHLEAIRDFDYEKWIEEGSRELAELKQSLIDRLPSKKAELEAFAKADAEEKTRLESQRKQREAAEKAKIEADRIEAEKKAKEAEELQKAQAQAATLFDQANAATPDVQAPEARQSYDIEVAHPAGWVELFQFWYQREGAKMALADMEKKTFKQIKAFAEKVAKDTGEKIDSKYLNYIPVVKAVNRK